MHFTYYSVIFFQELNHVKISELQLEAYWGIVIKSIVQLNTAAICFKLMLTILCKLKAHGFVYCPLLFFF
jgi:hypothetical protein